MVRYLEAGVCECGKEHTVAVEDVIIGSGAISRLPEFLKKYQAAKPFLLADCNTFAAAGEKVCQQLGNYSKYIFEQDNLEPDERAVGSAVMHFDPKCDLIIGVGSGVINDIGKILSNVSGRKYIIVGTAPSMDGYASATSSMSMDGLKGSKFLLQVTDYAMNTTTYLLEMQLGGAEELPGMIAYDLDNGYWTTFTKDSSYEELAEYASSAQTFFAATIVDHIVFK